MVHLCGREVGGICPAKVPLMDLLFPLSSSV